MALFFTVFQSIAIFLICLILKSTHVDSTADMQCSFPPGSIACKIWNYTNMDCSWRELICIPQLQNKDSLGLLDLSHNKLTVLPEDAFSGLIKLQTLNLSSNNISAINGDTFIGLNLLKTLDMSYNSLQSLPDSAFSALNLLETLNLSSNRLYFVHDNAFSGLQTLLNLDLNDNDISCVSNSTFAGLGNLKAVDLSWNYDIFILDPSFQHLYSLRTLSLSPFATITPVTFAGLNHTLQVLSIMVDYLTTHTPFVQISSLQHLELDIWTCSHVNESLFVGLDKLQYLELITPYECNIVIDFSSLISLSYLSYSDEAALDSQSYINSLNSLNSPLISLELHFDFVTTIFNSETFKSLPKWKESLQELVIYCEGLAVHAKVQIEGSPFQWFPQLRVLRIRGAFASTSLVFSKEYLQRFTKRTASASELSQYQ